MCTLVLLRRPDERWPLLIAANREELASRPWQGPGRHWPDRPDVVAGIDLQSGGSWLGLNEEGVVAAVLNRVGTLGPAAGKRSRGELVLEALDHADAASAAAALADLDPNAYRPFNLVVADARDAFWLRHAGGLPDFAIRTHDGAWREIEPIWLPDDTARRPRPEGSARIECRPIPPGLSMVTAHDLNDASAPRVRHYLARFEAAAPPDPDADAWQGWIELLAERAGPDLEPQAGMTIDTGDDYGTLCSHLIALPPFGTPIMRFCAERPGTAPFERVAL